MDVRFLVGDLELMPKDEEEPDEENEGETPEEPVDALPDGPTPENPFPSPEDQAPAEAASGQDAPVADDQSAAEESGGDISVSVSPVTKPGMMASASVTFSDGVTCDWYLDQFGRPGLVPPAEGYRPPDADMPIFGQKLQEALKGGY